MSVLLAAALLIHNVTVIGTDTPTPWIVPGASLHDELRLLREAGIPAMDVLRMATVRGEGAGGGAQMIAPGAPADLVLLARNPLDDIQNTRSIVCVIKRGTIVRGQGTGDGAQVVPSRRPPPVPRSLSLVPSSEK